MQLRPNVVVDPSLAIEAIVRAEGNLSLAAERLSRSLDIRLLPADLLGSIASDPLSATNLHSQLRLATTVKTFSLLQTVQDTLVEKMDDLRPGEVAKMHSSLIDLMVKLTASNETTQNVNITEVVMKLLPTNAREALLRLVDNPEVQE